MSKRPSLFKVGLSAASVIAVAATFLGASPAKADTASGSFVFTSFGGAISAYAGEIDSPGSTFDTVTVTPTAGTYDATNGSYIGSLQVVAASSGGAGTLIDPLENALTQIFGGAPGTPDLQLEVFDSVAQSGYLD